MLLTHWTDNKTCFTAQRSQVMILAHIATAKHLALHNPVALDTK